MIEFTLFGIPVRIQPWHWIGLAVLGGALNISEASDLLFVALFMIAGFLAILLHEFGHALVGRTLGGGGASIDLIFFGGYTQHYNCRLKGKQRALVIAAGPLATLLLGVFAFFLALIIMHGNLEATLAASMKMALNPYMAFAAMPNGSMEETTAMQLYFAGCMLFVSFWWTLFNILPIHPLDGGQLIAEYIRSLKKVHLIGLITSIIAALFAFFVFGSFLLTFFMLFFAYGNFKNYQSAPF